MSVMDYVTKLNEFSRFAPVCASTEEMRMDHFEQGWKESIKTMVVGHTYANFQKRYLKKVKIARVIDEKKG